MANISSSSAAASFEVDAAVWRALVGSSVEIPPINSHVYYFPEGHLEHTSPSSPAAAILNYNFTLSRPFIPCQVLSIRFLSDPSSDRPFVKMLLHPLGPRPCHNDHIINTDNAETENDVVSFAKALTPSDANNGGGFSVPKFCAEMVFPPLGSSGAPGRPPSQDLSVRDATRDHAWRFRHIFRGTPRRHLVSTGWTRFVKSKGLVTSDTVVFMRKKSTDELFVGVRRAQLSEARSCGDRDGCSCGCRRHGEALEARRRAEAGVEFEVVYYPEYGLPDFVVRVEKVRDALKMKWMVGMRVRTAMDGDDLSRMSWFQGTVEATSSVTWLGSPWRMLQVNWDEPEILDRRVCPWQVEHIPLIQPYLAPPPPKKLKAQPNIPGILLLVASEDARPTHHGSLGQHDPNNSNNSVGLPFLGSIHGTRPGDNRTIGQTSCGPPKNDDRPGFSAVSTVLSIGSSSVHVVGSQHGHGSGGYSFRLFGKNIVEMPEPVGGGGSTKCRGSCTCRGVD